MSKDNLKEMIKINHNQQTTPVNLRLQEVLAACGKAKETKVKSKRTKKPNEIKGEIKKMTKEVNVKIINNKPMVSSKDVSAIFGKDHGLIRKMIREVMEDQGSSEGVIESTFTHARNNITHPQYYMDFKRLELVANKFPFLRFNDLKAKYFTNVSNVLADEPKYTLEEEYDDPIVAAIEETESKFKGEIKEMTNEIKVFNFKENQVRTVIKGEDPWFVVKDVCDVLDLSNSRMALERLDDDEKGVSSI